MSAERWTRAEMWQWMLDNRPKRSERPKPNDYQKKNCKADALLILRYTVNADRLVVALYDYLHTVPALVYYLLPSGEHWCRAADSDVWTGHRLVYALDGGYYHWGSHRDESFFLSRQSFKEATTWIRNHFGGNWWARENIVKCSDLMWAIGGIEVHTGEERRHNTMERKLDRIRAWAEGIPALPAGFEEYAKKVIFGGKHYAIRRKGDERFLCTCCGVTQEPQATKDWKNHRDVVCPGCGATVRVEKSQKAFPWVQKVDRAMVALPYHTMKDDAPCAVMVHGIVYATYAERETIYFYPEVIIPVRADGSAVREAEIMYSDNYGGWRDTNPANKHAYACYAYPDLSALTGTCCEVAGLEDAARAGMRLNYNSLMRYYHGEPCVEYLVKGGYEHILRDMTDSCYARGSMFPHYHDLKTLFGLSGQGVRRLREHDGGCLHLLWLRAAETCGYKLSDEVWDWMVKRSITPTDAAFALSAGLSPEQMMHYVDKQLVRMGAKGVFRYETTFTTWKDTISMSTRLKADMSKDCVIRPRDLKERHDELAAIIAANEDKLKAQEADDKYPGCKPGCDAVRERFGWSDGEHICVVPTGAADIMREGRLLGHCVGSSDRYFERIAIGESYIVFLRRAKEPDKPWYTMEVEPGGRIRQLRTYGDNEGEERQEAKEFLKEWQKVVRARLTAEEREAAETATERYLRELQELIASGSLIRNGKLAGQPLGKVLAADYNELNEKEVAV